MAIVSTVYCFACCSGFLLIMIGSLVNIYCSLCYTEAIKEARRCVDCILMVLIYYACESAQLAMIVSLQSLLCLPNMAQGVGLVAILFIFLPLVSSTLLFNRPFAVHDTFLVTFKRTQYYNATAQTVVHSCCYEKANGQYYD